MQLNFDVVPGELKARPNFVGHKAKCPMNPKTYLAASSTDRETWGSYDQAVEAARVNGWDGIGFCFEPPYVGIDMDHSVENGVINDFAKGVIEQCNSYTEISPSGTGIHIIVRGTIPRSFKTDQIEVYDKGRYFTLTGNIVRPYGIIRTVDLGFLFRDKEKQIALRNTDESWVLKDLEAIKPGVGNSGRTPTFTRVIGYLKAKGLREPEVTDYLAKWAEKHSFGLDRLKRLVEDQFRRYPAPIRSGDDAGADHDSDSLVAFMADAAPHKYVVANVIVENTINVFAGLQGSKKSWILLDLAVALASGTLWMDRFQCRQSRVMVIDQERPKREMQRRLSALAKGRGFEITSLESQLIPKAMTERPYHIDSDQSFERLCRKIEAVKPDVLLVDSLKKFTKVKVVDSAMLDVMERINILRNRFGLTIGILHHENKKAYERQREGREITAENVAGDSSINEVPEGIFIVELQDLETSVFHPVKGSFGEKVAPFVVKVVDTKEDKSAIRVESY